MRLLHCSAVLLLAAAAPVGAQYVEAYIPVDSGPTAIAVNSAGNRVYVGDNFIFRTEGAVEIIDAVENRHITTVRRGWFCNRAWANSAANRAYAAMQTGELLVFDGDGDSLLGEIPTSGTVTAFCFDSAANRIYYNNRLPTSTLSIYDCLGDTLLTATIPTPGWPRALCYNSAMRRLYCVTDSGVVAVIDADSNTVVGRIPVRSWPTAVCCSPASNRVYLANWGGGIEIIDCTGDSVIDTLPVHARFLLWQPDDDEVYACGHSPELPVIDCAGDSLLCHIDVGDYQERACYVPGTRSIFCIVGSQVKVIDCATHTIRTAVWVGGYPIDLAWSPYLDRIYVACQASNSVAVIREVAPGAAEERKTPGASRIPPAASIVRSVLNLPPPLTPCPASLLLDASGRRVMVLRSGENDVSRLAPGVYFLHSSFDIRHSSLSKVVLAR